MQNTQIRFDDAIRTAKAAVDLEDNRPGRREHGPLHAVRWEARAGGTWGELFNAAGEKVGETGRRK